VYTDSKKDTAISNVARIPEADLKPFFPNMPKSRKPSSGRRGISMI
jgi:hypothetical protein